MWDDVFQTCSLKESPNANKARPRCRLRLQTKLGIAFSILVIFTSAILILTLFMNVRGHLRNDIRERLINIARLAALQIDGDMHATLTERSQETSPDYYRIKWTLQKIRDASPNVRFIYTWRLNDVNELVFVVDAETDPKEMSHIGEVFHSEKYPLLGKKLVHIKGAVADEEFDVDKWGVWLSGYAPFYKSGGIREGIVGVDIAATDVLAKERNFLWAALIVFIFAVPPTAAMGWFLGHKLTAPIAKLITATKKIMEGNLSYRAPISCYDEIGKLAESFNNMTQQLQDEIIARGKEIVNRSRAEKKLAELNRQLEKTIDKLSEANRELSEVAFIAAHDLKTPVRAVGSLASMIRMDYKDKLDKETINNLNTITFKAEKMSELLDGMLQYCRLERITDNCKKINLNEVVKRIIMEIKAPENIEIVIENELPEIDFESNHAELLFGHLIKNAVKFIDKPKGRITIACRDSKDYWKISVSDNGPGIEQRHFSKIFKLFQTLNARDDFSGAGVGLSIAKKIIELYNGAIWVESNIGHGSTFYFALPKTGCEKSAALNESLSSAI